jgi:hypothetical protein
MGATMLLHPIFHICFGSQLNGEVFLKLPFPPMDGWRLNSVKP